MTALRNYILVAAFCVVLLSLVGYQFYGKYLIDWSYYNRFTYDDSRTFDICSNQPILMQANATSKRNDFIFERLNRIVESERFQQLVQNQVDGRDPRVVSLVREMMDPPSLRMRKHSRPPFDTPQAAAMRELIDPKKHQGFFVECGALDGERSSNTDVLETKNHWTGLLIEADPSYYTQILGKNRKTWSINACLSPHPYTSFLSFAENSHGQGHLDIEGVKGPKSDVIYKIPCFTLESMLLALNRTSIDFFSLDVEGAELDVLKSTSFDRIDIKTLTVEYSHVKGGKQGLISFLSSHGMQFYKLISKRDPAHSFYAEDLFFAKSQLIP